MCLAMLPATALASGIEGPIPDGLVIEDTVVTKYTGSETSLTIPEGVTEIGSSAFSDNETLTSISLPSTLKSIDQFAFCDNIALTSVEFVGEGTLISIGNYAFLRCSSLESVALPGSVTTIGAEAFKDCTSLTSVSMQGVTSVGANAFESTALKSVHGPVLTDIGPQAFRQCSELSEIDFPNLQTIGYNAFSGTGFTEFALPSTVSAVGYNFLDSKNLTRVTVSLKSLLSPDINKGAFGYLDSGTEIVLTDVAQDITLLEEGIEVEGREIPLNDFLVTTVKDPTSGIITNNTGQDVTVVSGESFVVIKNGTSRPVGADAQGNALLEDLSLSSDTFELTLDPEFSSLETGYSSNVGNGVASVVVVATPSDPSATFTVNGQAPSGEGNAVEVALSEGENTIQIVVTAPDGTTTETYTVTVQRSEPIPEHLVISTAEELMDFAAKINDGTYVVDDTVGMLVELGADIDMDGYEWVPIGISDDQFFAGIFDGNGHTISNLSVTNADGCGSYLGLFGATVASILDVNITGTFTDLSSGTSGYYFGPVAGFTNGDIIGCTAEFTVTGENGRLCGQLIGGVAGFVSGPDSTPLTMENCVSRTTIQGETNKLIAGGVAGAFANTEVINCRNEGALSLSGSQNYVYVGGIAGQTQTGTVLDHCVNNGNVAFTGTSVTTHVGGICGRVSSQSEFISCVNNGPVGTSASHVGGIVGAVYYGDGLSIKGCMNAGPVSSTREGACVAGILTHFGSVGTAAIVGNVSVGKVTGTGEDAIVHPVAVVKGATDEKDLDVRGNFYDEGLTIQDNANEIPEAVKIGSTAINLSGQLSDETLDKINSGGGSFRLDESGNIEVVPLTYELTVTGSAAAASGAGAYEEGATVHLDAGSRPGYTFAGWEGPDGVAFANASSARTTLTMPAADVSVTATWRAIPYVPDPGHDVEVTEPERGTVAIDPDRAEEGEEVTVTPTPDEGFEVGDVTVTDEGGEPVEVTGNADGTWSFVMPDGEVTVTVTFRCDGGELCPTNGFTDVDQFAWYHDAVDWAVVNGVLNGYGEGGTSLGPVAPITRAEMAQMLWNRAGRPEATADLSEFTDVDADGWYAPALAWCVSEGIFSGYGDTFGTERTISREEAATVLWRVAGSPEADADLSGYGDASKVSDYATGAIEWAVANGVLTGKGNVALDPQGGCTRGEVAAMLMRMAEGA